MWYYIAIYGALFCGFGCLIGGIKLYIQEYNEYKALRQWHSDYTDWYNRNVVDVLKEHEAQKACMELNNLSEYYKKFAEITESIRLDKPYDWAKENDND